MIKKSLSQLLDELEQAAMPAPDGAWPMRIYESDEELLAAQQAHHRRYGIPVIEMSAENGSVDPRLVVVGVGLFALFGIVFLVWLLWPYLVGAGILYAAFRHLTRGTRRRRPRSSWSSLGRTAALLYAAWNSRWLKPSDRRVTVPARADYGGRWDQ